MKWFGKLIESVSRFFRNPNDTVQKNQPKININTIKQQVMAKKTVITKVLDTEARDGVIEFPQNRTLYVDQFTDNAPNTDEEREGFKPRSMKEVFEHYRPTKEGIDLNTEEGGVVYEDFEFRQIKDFEDDRLIEQSALLSDKKAKIDAYQAIIFQLEKNKSLRSVLKEANSRESLVNVLKSLLAEIENAD